MTIKKPEPLVLALTIWKTTVLCIFLQKPESASYNPTVISKLSLAIHAKENSYKVQSEAAFLPITSTKYHTGGLSYNQINLFEAEHYLSSIYCGTELAARKKLLQVMRTTRSFNTKRGAAKPTPKTWLNVRPDGWIIAS